MGLRFCLCLLQEADNNLGTVTGIAPSNFAIVTLIVGDEKSDYVSGALALGQSLVDASSTLRRIAMVTEKLPEESRVTLSKFWEVVVVDLIPCNQSFLDGRALNIEDYKHMGFIYDNTKRLYNTCTKLNAWSLPFERIIFMDSDMIVRGPIDHLLQKYTKKKFYAAPDGGYPDEFNSGFMIISPSNETFLHLLLLNRNNGTHDGGDQGLLNNQYCQNWHDADAENTLCGRLPWVYNTFASAMSYYADRQRRYGFQEPVVIHYTGIAKPWTTLLYEYAREDYAKYVHPDVRVELPKQVEMHVLWRQVYFKAIGDGNPPPTRVLYALVPP